MSDYKLKVGDDVTVSDRFKAMYHPHFDICGNRYKIIKIGHCSVLSGCNEPNCPGRITLMDIKTNRAICSNWCFRQTDNCFALSLLDDNRTVFSGFSKWWLDTQLIKHISSIKDLKELMDV